MWKTAALMENRYLELGNEVIFKDMQGHWYRRYELLVACVDEGISVEVSELTEKKN